MAPEAPTARHDAALDFRMGDAGDAHIRAATTGGEVFERFFAAYDRAFVLPDEKEGRDGFLECLALNHGDAYARLSALHGPYREWVLVVEEDGDVAGGANFICHPVRARKGADAPWLLAMNLNYVFVNATHRGRGHLRRLVGACRRLARKSFVAGGAATDPATMPLLLFFELNDPLRMDAGDYALDSAHAGVDQFDRVGIWGRLGARIIDFPYLQPPLSAAQDADDGLVLGVIGADAPALDGCVLGGHLERFFSVSVLKGVDARGPAASRRQLELCDAACDEGRGFALLDPLPRLGELRALRDAAAGTRRELREALARGGTGG